MPVFRYFIVMGCCLVGLLFAADLMWPGDRVASADNAAVMVAGATPAKSGSASQASAGGKAIFSSTENWRRSEHRFEGAKHHPRPVIYPNVATLAPTPDRLQWERQLRYLPADHVYEARAEMPKEATADAERPKVAAKTATRKHVTARPARIAPEAERPRYARNAAWDPFGLFD